MRKNVLALSIATMIGGLGFAGSASALVITGTGAAPSGLVLGATNATTFNYSVGGTGHQLITPYFNAQNGNGTVFHVVNTDTVNGKAVKVRFRGASNSDDILDFYVLLSPSDTWTGVVTAGSNGFASITTADNSCTYPRIAPGTAQPFVPNRLNQSWTTAVQANNTREGYVEMFVAADIPSAAVYNATNVGTGTVRSNLYTAIKHVSGVAPCTLSALDGALLTDKTNEAQAAGFGFATPTGRVAGSWYIINVPQTTTFSGDMTALVAVDGTGVQARGNYVVFPQIDGAVANAENYTADPLLSGSSQSGRAKSAAGVLTVPQATAVIPAAQYDLPDLSTPYVVNAGIAAYPNGAIPVSGPANPRNAAANLTAQLAVSGITNQYATDASISAKTDWVFSMPTRRYHVAYDYAATGSTLKTVYSLVPATGNQYFHDGNVTVDTGNAQLCVNLAGGSQSFFDREENGNSSGAVFSPGSVSNTRFCGETSVLSFLDAGNSALSASVARQTVTTGVFTNGYSVLNTTNATTGLGLPIIGSAFIKLTNPAATPGVSGNYGITWSHINAR